MSSTKQTQPPRRTSPVVENLLQHQQALSSSGYFSFATNNRPSTTTITNQQQQAQTARNLGASFGNGFLLKTSSASIANATATNNINRPNTSNVTNLNSSLMGTGPASFLRESLMVAAPPKTARPGRRSLSSNNQSGSGSNKNNFGQQSSARNSFNKSYASKNNNNNFRDQDQFGASYASSSGMLSNTQSQRKKSNMSTRERRELERHRKKSPSQESINSQQQQQQQQQQLLTSPLLAGILAQQQQLQQIHEEDFQNLSEEDQVRLLQTVNGIPEVLSLGGTAQQQPTAFLRFTATATGGNAKPLPPRQFFVAQNSFSSGARPTTGQNFQTARFAMFGLGNNNNIQRNSDEENFSSTNASTDHHNHSSPTSASSPKSNTNTIIIQRQQQEEDSAVVRPKTPPRTTQQQSGIALPRRAFGILSEGSTAMLHGNFSEEQQQQQQTNSINFLKQHQVPPILTTAATTAKITEEHEDDHSQNVVPLSPRTGGVPRKDGVSTLFSGQSVLFSDALMNSVNNINAQPQQPDSPSKSLLPSWRRPMTSTSNSARQGLTSAGSTRSSGGASGRRGSGDKTDSSAYVGGAAIISQQQIHSITQYQQLLEEKLRRGGELDAQEQEALRNKIGYDSRNTKNSNQSSPQRNNNVVYHSASLRATQKNQQVVVEDSEMERVADLDPTEVTPRSHRPQSARLSDLFSSLKGSGEHLQQRKPGEQQQLPPGSARTALGNRRVVMNNNNNNTITNQQNNNSNNNNTAGLPFPRPTSGRQQQQQQQFDDSSYNNRSTNNNTINQQLPAASGRPSTASKRLDVGNNNNNNTGASRFPNTTTNSQQNNIDYGLVVGNNAFDNNKQNNMEKMSKEELMEMRKLQQNQQERRQSSPSKQQQQRSSPNSRKSSPTAGRFSRQKQQNQETSPNRNPVSLAEAFNAAGSSAIRMTLNNSNEPNKPVPMPAIDFFSNGSNKVVMHEAPSRSVNQPHTVVLSGGNNNNNQQQQKTASGFGPRLSPAEALAKDEAKLTRYEKMEILEYDDIYFTGAKVFAQKIQAPIDGAVNFGYDDERGEYLTVKGDHVAFRYEVQSELGRGSFGQVLKVFDHKRQQHCALKLIRNKKRFLHQAQIEIRILDHLRSRDVEEKSCTVRMLNYFQFRNHVVITFELHAANLYELTKLNKHMAFPMQLIRRFAGQLLVALSFLHKEKIMHCDLKPENILLRQENKTGLRVIDFGSSCFEGDASYQYIQSRFYRAPEVILHMQYGRPMDAWSLGCILAEMQLGYPLFAGENEKEQMLLIMETLGVPPTKMLERAPLTRRKEFFDVSDDGKVHTPRVIPSAKGKIHKPGSRVLSTILNTSDDLFVDFVAGFLRWDPLDRFTPMDGMNHPWIADLFTGKNDREGNITNQTSQLVTSGRKK